MKDLVENISTYENPDSVRQFPASRDLLLMFEPKPSPAVDWWKIEDVVRFSGESDIQVYVRVVLMDLLMSSRRALSKSNCWQPGCRVPLRDVPMVATMSGCLVGDKYGVFQGSLFDSAVKEGSPPLIDVIVTP